jgi:hypothetical protein
VLFRSPDGSQPKTALSLLDKKKVLIPSRFIAENLTEKEYRAAKGIIDHETGHVRWPDISYLPSNNEDDEDSGLIYDIGTIIDDIRIERKMNKEFRVDKDNFRYYFENFIKNMTEYEIDEYLRNNLFAFSVSRRYRGIDISFLPNRPIPISTGFFQFFKDMVIPIIDRFIVSDEKGGDVAREILQIWRNV